MPINIPRLDRLKSTSQSTPGDRLDFKVQDQAGLIQQNTGNIAGLAEEGLELYGQVEDNKIVQLSNEAEQEYAEWDAKKRNSLRGIKGDPTDSFNVYEKEEKEKAKSIIEARPDLNERVKRHLTTNLDRVRDTKRIQALKQKGLQQETYENNLYESTLKLRKDEMPVNAGFINKEDPTSFFPFDQQVQSVKDTIVKRGLKTGTVTKLKDNAKNFSHIFIDAEGKTVKVKLSPIAQERTAREVSKGVVSSIEVLINGGQPEEAEMLRKRYKGYIDPVTNSRLNTKFEKDATKTSAFTLVDSLRGLDVEKQLDTINAETDPEIRSEALKILDTNNNRIASIRRNKSTANYNNLANHVINRMGSANPYHGISQLENDPVFKESWDKIQSPSQKKAVMELLEPPKESSVGSVARVQRVLFGEDPEFQVEKMTVEQFSELLVGTSKKDRDKYMGKFEKIRIQSAGEQRSSHKRSKEFLVNELLKHEEVEKDIFGKFDEDDTNTINNAGNELMDHLDSQIGVMNDKQMKDFAIEFTAAKINEKPFRPENVKGQRRGQGVEKFNLTPTERSNLKFQFRKQNGYIPKTNSREFSEFVRNSRQQ